MAGDSASTPGPHRRDAKHRGSAASALTRSPATPWSHPCGPGAGREHSESGPVGQPRSHWKPQACPALRLGRGRTGEAPLGHSPSRPRSRPVPTRHRHYLIPTEEQEPSRGRETPAPTHVASLGQPGAQPQAPLPGHSARDAPCPCYSSMAQPYTNPTAGKWRLPSPPTGDAQPGASRARSTTHSSQALTDRQTDRRGQAAAIPAPPTWKNSRRLDPDQVFPQVLFDMNIKGASQIPSTVRGLKNPYH